MSAHETTVAVEAVVLENGIAHVAGRARCFNQCFRCGDPVTEGWESCYRYTTISPDEVIGLELVDVSDPSEPSYITKDVFTGGNETFLVTFDMKLQDGLVFAALAFGEVQVADTTSPLFGDRGPLDQGDALANRLFRASFGQVLDVDGDLIVHYSWSDGLQTWAPALSGPRVVRQPLGRYPADCSGCGETFQDGYDLVAVGGFSILVGGFETPPLLRRDIAHLFDHTVPEAPRLVDSFVLSELPVTSDGKVLGLVVLDERLFAIEKRGRNASALAF